MATATTSAAAGERCRCCMAPSAAAKDLTSEYDWMGEKEVYSDMLLESFDIKLERVESAGWKICEVCITRLRDSSNFKKQVLYSEKCLLKTARGGGGAPVHEAAEAKPAIMKFEVGSECGDDSDEFETQYLDDDDDTEELKEVSVKFEPMASTSEMSNDEDVPLSSLSTAVKRKAPVKTVVALAAKSPKLTVKQLKARTTVKIVPTRGKPQYALPTPIPIKADKSEVLGPMKPLHVLPQATAKNVKGAKSPVKAAGQQQTTQSPLRIKVRTIPELMSPAKTKSKTSAETSSKGRVAVGIKVRTSSEPRTVSRTQVAINKAQAHMTKMNSVKILQYSSIIPFKWSLRDGFFCFYCKLPFTDTEDLKLHTRDVHNQAEAPEIVDAIKYDNHVKVDITAINCNFCCEPFDSAEAVMEHLEDDHGKIFYTEANLGVIPFRLAENTFVCAVCEKVCTTFHTLNQHVAEHFKNYICEKCGKGLMTAQLYAKHLKKHTFGFVCSMCGESFISHSNLRRHRLDVHTPNRFQCPDCPEAFPDKLRKETHCIKVHNAKDYKCDICGGLYTSTQTLAVHKRRAHLNQLNHFCEMCNKGFFFKHKLTEHMRVHTGERPHACEYCGQTFRLRTGLKRHILIHKTDKTFFCGKCDRSFVKWSSMKWHTKSHHKA